MMCNILSDLFSIQLTLIGISFSIFTIFYSLVVGKLEQLNLISKQIKSGKGSPEIKQMERFCLNTISRLKKTNRFVIYICSISISLSVLLGIIRHLTIPNIVLYIVIGINWVDFLFIISLIIWVFYTYHRKTKYN